jgi:hypothetical protein
MRVKQQTLFHKPPSRLTRGQMVRLSAEAREKGIDPAHDNDMGKVVGSAGCIALVRWTDPKAELSYHEDFLEGS